MVMPNPPNITSHSIDLSPGANVITIMVTAARLRNNGDLHGQSNARYFQRRDTVLTEPDDHACGRHGLAIDLKDMDGMTAEFMADIDMYYANVDAGVDMIEVMATAMDSDATVSGDGAVSLDVGENTITVTVTAEDGTTMMTYTVMVTVKHLLLKATCLTGTTPTTPRTA